MYKIFKMANSRPEQELRLPAELVRKCAGFSYDIGGSVMKVVYRSKEDYDDSMQHQEEGALGTVRLVSFSRQELDEAVEFIRDNAYISRIEGEETSVYTTGVGGFQYKDKMEKALNVKNTNLSESDCFTHSFMYILKTMPREEILHPFMEAAITKAMHELKINFAPYIDILKIGTTNVTFPGFDGDIKDLTIEMMMGSIEADLVKTGDPKKPMGDEDIFPVNLGLCGSAFGFLQIMRDGTFSAGDISNRGGRSMLAMAYLFLDCQSFDEFLELAAKGDCENVDWCQRDMMNEMGNAQETDKENLKRDDDIYSVLADINPEEGANELVFCFGQGVGKTKADFKREDLAAALLRFYCNDLAQFIDMSVRQVGNESLKHIFIGGGFAGSETVRYVLTREITWRVGLLRFMTAGQSKAYQVHFLKHGQHLGCLGGLINTTDHFIKVAGQEVPEVKTDAEKETTKL